MEPLRVDVSLPSKLMPLLEGYEKGKRDSSIKRRRYYVAYGGRDSAKSWSFARALIILCMYDPLVVVCVREIQRTIADSVHRLLKSQIEGMGLGAYFDVRESVIRCKASGAEIIFAGLRDLDATKIKSLEGADIAWVEEAHSVSKASWNTLIPTIRAPESEIWASFNPDMDTDPVYEMFVTRQQDDAWVQRVNWNDNPWWSAVLESHRKQMEREDPEEYRHVYGGEPRTVVAGAIYAREITAMIEGRRVRPMPYDPSLPVHTVWDLGWNDAMTIIMVQKVPSALMVIDYIEDSFRTYAEYVAELSERRWVWGKDWLPHDGEAKDPKSGKSAKQVLEALGRRVQIIPRLDVESGIKAARMLFPRVYMDETRRELKIGETGHRGVARLLDCLKRYRRSIPSTTGEPAGPVHDEYSHGADAWRGLAMIVDQIKNDDRPMVRVQPWEPADAGAGM